MLFISAADFFDKVRTISPLTDEDVRALVLRMNDGDAVARDRLVQGYLPFVATFIRRAPRRMQTLHTVYACIACVRTAVAQFDFSRGRRAFAVYLGQRLRRCMIRCLIGNV